MHRTLLLLLPSPPSTADGQVDGAKLLKINQLMLGESGRDIVGSWSDLIRSTT